MALAAHGLKKIFRDARARHVALDDVSFSVADAQTLVILGPSGAGKTTLLRVIAGLENADEGSMLLDGRELLDLPAESRRVGLVFERDALFPHLNVAGNLAFAARRNGVAAIAQKLELGDLVHKKPDELSAGERQCAALARAVLSEPRVLLLDEPFAHLDPQLRAGVRRTFKNLVRSFDGSVIHVTHDHAEALSAGDRLAIMIDGRIVQCDSPQRVYDYPATTLVARFFGSPPMNLFEDGMETIGIRPEHIRVENGGALHGRIRAVESTGADSLVQLTTEKGELIARTPSSQRLSEGDEVNVTFPEAFVRRYDRTSGQLRA